MRFPVGVSFALTCYFYFDVRISIGGCHDFIRHTLICLGKFAELAADEAFSREDGVFRVGDGLTLCCLADETFSVFSESYYGWCCARTFGVLKNCCLTAVHDGHTGVGCAEVDS